MSRKQKSSVATTFAKASVVEKAMEDEAETEGFEPSKQFPVYTLSKRTSSATRAGLHSVLRVAKIGILTLPAI